MLGLGEPLPAPDQPLLELSLHPLAAAKADAAESQCGPEKAQE
jgi:hypothetical protein